MAKPKKKVQGQRRIPGVSITPRVEVRVSKELHSRLAQLQNELKGKMAEVASEAVTTRLVIQQRLSGVRDTFEPPRSVKTWQIRTPQSEPVERFGGLSFENPEDVCRDLIQRVCTLRELGYLAEIVAYEGGTIELCARKAVPQ